MADMDLVVIAAANARGTLCLASALACHDLTDRIPPRIDVAVPRDVFADVLDEVITFADTAIAGDFTDATWNPPDAGAWSP